MPGTEGTKDLATTTTKKKQAKPLSSLCSPSSGESDKSTNRYYKYIHKILAATTIKNQGI